MTIRAPWLRRLATVTPDPCPLGLCDGWGLITVAGVTGSCLCVETALIPDGVSDRIWSEVQAKLDRYDGDRPAILIVRRREGFLGRHLEKLLVLLIVASFFIAWAVLS